MNAKLVKEAKMDGMWGAKKASNKKGIAPKD
jgi:hypothetical protein